MKALTTLSKEFSCEDLTIKRSGGGLLVCLVSPTEKLTEEELNYSSNIESSWTSLRLR